MEASFACSSFSTDSYDFCLPSFALVKRSCCARCAGCIIARAWDLAEVSLGAKRGAFVLRDWEARCSYHCKAWLHFSSLNFFRYAMADILPSSELAE